jgi:hypothetical protein
MVQDNLVTKDYRQYHILDISSHKEGNIIVPLTLNNIQKYGFFQKDNPRNFTLLVKIDPFTVVRYGVIDVKRSEISGDFVILVMAPNKLFLKEEKRLNYKMITIRVNTTG